MNRLKTHQSSDLRYNKDLKIMTFVLQIKILKMPTY